MSHDPPAKIYGEFNEDDPRFQVRILGNRLDQMVIDHTKERTEDALRISLLEKKLEELQKVYQRGIGGVGAILGLGVIIGFLFHYGDLIFAPWRGKS